MADTSGEAVIWEMNGTTVIGGGSLGNPGPSWQVLGWVARLGKN